MLFTGSKKYPEADLINKIVHQFNGEENGQTSDFDTSYYYSLDTPGLNQLIDVLLDAVINPLFDLDQLIKEMKNVNSEISMRMVSNDKINYFKLLKELSLPLNNLFNDGF